MVPFGTVHLLLLIASSHGALSPARRARPVVARSPSGSSAPLLKLRGGLLNIDAEKFSLIPLTLFGLQGAYSTLAPADAAEMYGRSVSEGSVQYHMLQQSGLCYLTQALVIIKAMGGMPVAEAVGWGMVPWCLLGAKNILQDTPGLPTRGKYIPATAILLFALGCFGKLPLLDAATTLKVMTVWNAVNGLVAYFAPQVFASSYGVDDSDALLSDTKAFGAAITGSAIIFAGFSFLNKTPLETLGLLMSAYFLALADSEFVTKWGAGMGMTEGKMIPWMALQGLTALTIFTGGKGGGEVSVRN